jgi:hypothetical protein
MTNGKFVMNRLNGYTLMSVQQTMGSRLMVGHLTLDQAVGVRVPAPQPIV